MPAAVVPPEVAPINETDPAAAYELRNPAPPKGTGALITGIALIATCGVPATFTGVAAVERVQEGRSIFFEDGGAIATLAFGISSLGVGTLLTALGGVRRARYNEWKRLQQFHIAPTQSRTSKGTQLAGVSVRF